MASPHGNARLRKVYEMTKTGEIAAAIRGAYAGGPISPVRAQLPPSDIDAAYAIQEANTVYWESDGRRIIGCKIGLTSTVVQRQLGVDRPDFGMLFADMLVGEDDPVLPTRILQPRIEAEVAFLIDRDIDIEKPTIADVIRAVAYVMPALELVGNRRKLRRIVSSEPNPQR
jgi:2-keto-4-pentenoate hydratase